MKATIKALQYSMQNRAELLKIIPPYLGIKDAALVEQLYDLYLTRQSVDGSVDENWMKGAIEFTQKTLGAAPRKSYPARFSISASFKKPCNDVAVGASADFRSRGKNFSSDANDAVPYGLLSDEPPRLVVWSVSNMIPMECGSKEAGRLHFRNLFRRSPALSCAHSTRTTNLIGRFDIENQKAMDGSFQGKSSSFWKNWDTRDQRKDSRWLEQ